jgi:diphthine synthase
MPLLLVGLGLGDEKDVTIAGLEAIQSADTVYLEAYTSVLGVKAEKLEAFYGCKINISDRHEVESATEKMLDQANSGTVAFLVVGDPYCATTHTDLVLRARKRGISVRVYHNASIMSAAGCCGLHLYNFGRTISIPYFMDGATDETKQTSYYDYLQFNDSGGLHTLCLLDIKVKEPNVEAARQGKLQYDPPRFMTVNQALEQLLDCERIRGQKVLDPNTTMCVGLARVGRIDQLIVAGTINELLNVNFGQPLHSMIICSGELHELEKAMLQQYKPTDDVAKTHQQGGDTSQVEWAMESTVSSIAVVLEEEEEQQEVDVQEMLNNGQGGFAAAMAAVAAEDDDGNDEVASECSDMSDVSDIFPDMAVGSGAMDSESEEEEA